MDRTPYTLVGVDGNAFSIMAYVKQAMRKAKFSDDMEKDYLIDATSSDYNHLISVSLDMIDNVNKALFGDSYDG